MAVNERAETLRLRISGKIAERDSLVRDKQNPAHLNHTINSLQADIDKLQSKLTDAKHRQDTLDECIDCCNQSLAALQHELQIELNTSEICKLQKQMQQLEELAKSLPPEVLAQFMAQRNIK